MELLRLPSGSVWVREVVDPVAPPDRLPEFSGFFTQGSEAQPRVEDLLFLDTETTGLAGGTGTIAFLVGASWWTSAGLVTRQYFLASPGQEPAMLEALAALADRFRVVMTFNGASFDLPLLRTRALMNRTDDPLANLVGWDLLVPARRLWGRRLENCRQQTLETGVCSLAEREGDIDGSQIPAVWFEFLATGRVDRWELVMAHNRLDMTGMASLFGQVVEAAVRVGCEDPGDADPVDWRDAWSLARICERRQDRESALRWMRRAFIAAIAEETAPVDPRFLADSIRIIKRGGEWRLVKELIDWGLADEQAWPWLHREAAILYERRLVDLELALAHARRSGEDVRCDRLQRKLSARKEEVSG